MNVALFLSTNPGEWSWRPNVRRDGPRRLRNGQQYLWLNASWLCFGFQIDNER